MFYSVTQQTIVFRIQLSRFGVTLEKEFLYIRTTNLFWIIYAYGKLIHFGYTFISSAHCLWCQKTVLFSYQSLINCRLKTVYCPQDPNKKKEYIYITFAKSDKSVYTGNWSEIEAYCESGVYGKDLRSACYCSIPFKMRTYSFCKWAVTGQMVRIFFYTPSGQTF